MTEEKAGYNTEAQEAMEMLGKGYKPVIQFEPPSEQIVETDNGYAIAQSLGWVKISAYFRENMLAKLKGAKLSVFLCICLHVNEKREAFPSVQTIAKETDLHRDTVMDTIAELEAIPGLLDVIRRRGKSSIYKPSFVARGEKNNPVIPVDKIPTGRKNDKSSGVVVDVSPTTPVDVSPTLSRKIKKREEELTAAAVSAFNTNPSQRDAEILLCNTSGLAALPGGMLSQIDTVYQLLQTYPKEQVTSALESAKREWMKNKRKDNGRNYSILNPAWIDWAVAHLAGETPWTESKSQTALEKAMEYVNE